MASSIEHTVVLRGGRLEAPARHALATSPLLAALRAAGTRHVYADTADVDELRALLETPDGALLREVDGNTVNQPLALQVVARYLSAGEPRAWASELSARAAGSSAAGISRAELYALLYTILCGRIGNDMVRAFSAGRPWETSLQLHMGVSGDRESARRVGRLQRSAVPSALVKIPFAPDAPACFLVARDLEEMGIPVNFTSTFSARQAVAAALLANVSRTNVFMGRLDQALGAARLGEHVVREAQRALLALRREAGVPTELIVASLRDWRSLVRLAGCDVFTVPCAVLRAFLEQAEVAPERIEPGLARPVEGDLGVSPAALERLGPARIARLHQVEPAWVELLLALRAERLDDADSLRRRVEAAGFGDFFHVPDAAEREELERGKLPRLDGPLTPRLALDTHMSLLANADFARAQREIDAELERRLDATLR